MGNSQSALNPLRLFRANKQRDQAIDVTLSIVQTSLQTLSSVADLLPVAGVGTAVSLLQMILQQVQVSPQLLVHLCTLVR